MENATHENFAARLCENDSAVASHVTAVQEGTELYARAVSTCGASSRLQIGTFSDRLHWVLGTLRGVGSNNGHHGYGNFWGSTIPPTTLGGGTYILRVQASFVVLELFNDRGVPIYRHEGGGHASGIRGTYTGAWN